MVTFLKTQLQVIVKAVLLTAILFFIHYSVMTNVFPKETLILPLYKIYLFHLIVTTIVIVAVNYKSLQKESNLFNVFMLFTFVKMILALVFLLPVFLSTAKNRNTDAINFFIPYFIYLAFEVFIITKLLQRQK